MSSTMPVAEAGKSRSLAAAPTRRDIAWQEGDPMEVKRSVVAWTGRSVQGKVRLYKTTWENPWPDLEIKAST